MTSIEYEKWIKNTFMFFLKHFKWIITFLIAFSIADISILYISSFLIPKENSQLKIKKIQGQSRKNTSKNFIYSTNIFHNEKTPPPLTFSSETEKTTSVVDFSKSSKSSLPFKLLGTIESSTPSKSMATISYKKESNSYTIGDIIDKKARITSIERRKVTFINLNNNLLEFIQILDNTSSLQFNVHKEEELPIIKKPIIPKPSFKGITKEKEGNFSLNRSMVNDHLKDLPNILQQARVNPQLGEEGSFIGYKFSWIKKGSVFEGLGFKQGDIILSVNGENPTDQSQATNLFQKLRNESQISVQVKDQDGNINDLTYNVNEDTSMKY